MVKREKKLLWAPAMELQWREILSMDGEEREYLRL